MFVARITPRSQSAPTHAAGQNDTIQVDRLSTSLSLNVGTNDIQETGIQVLDSTHYQSIHHYSSDDDEVVSNGEVVPAKEGSLKGRWKERLEEDKLTGSAAKAPGYEISFHSAHVPKEEVVSPLSTLFPNAYSLKPKRQLSYHAPIRYSHTMTSPLMTHSSHPSSDLYGNTLTKFTNDVNTIVIVVGGVVGLSV